MDCACDNAVNLDEDGQTLDDLMSAHVGLTYRYAALALQVKFMFR